MNSEDLLKEQASIFKAFCDPNRLEILHLLKDGEECACHLLEKLGIVQATLSYHMKMLCDSGVVSSRKDGKWTYYRIDPKGLEKAITILEEMKLWKS